MPVQQGLSMPGLLIEHAEVLVTMDSDRHEIADAAIFTDDRQVLFVGTSNEVRKWILDQGEKAERVIDASGTVIIPGLVNCHHHLYQTLTRSIGTAQGLSLFDCLKLFTRSRGRWTLKRFILAQNWVW